MKPVPTKAYIDVERKADELGLSVPDAVWIVPTNFERMKSVGEAMYDADYDLVVKLLRSASLPYSLLKSTNRTYPKLVQQSFELAALPLLIFTRDVLESRPEIISRVLCILLDHFRDRSRNDPGKDKNSVKCHIVKEDEEGYVRADYEGPVEGLKDFIEGLK